MILFFKLHIKSERDSRDKASSKAIKRYKMLIASKTELSILLLPRFSESKQSTRDTAPHKGNAVAKTIAPKTRIPQLPG